MDVDLHFVVIIVIIIFFLIWILVVEMKYNGRILPDNYSAEEEEPGERRERQDDTGEGIEEEPMDISTDPDICIEEEPSLPLIDYTPATEATDPIDSKHASQRTFRSKGEKATNEAMQRIFGAAFITQRPSWLINPKTGYRLELDCYNESLHVAAEYNGIQHYQFPNFTGQSYESFIAQIARDKVKMDICNRRGVFLIIVPYNIAHDRIEEYVRKLAREIPVGHPAWGRY